MGHRMNFRTYHIFVNCSSKHGQLESVTTGLAFDLARGYKTFFMLNSTEHEISTGHKN